jgi:hypothetical protein
MTYNIQALLPYVCQVHYDLAEYYFFCDKFNTAEQHFQAALKLTTLIPVSKYW